MNQELLQRRSELINRCHNAETRQAWQEAFRELLEVCEACDADLELERKLKARKNTPKQLCPICRGEA